MEITYELIKPIIVKEDIQGNQIHLEFKTEDMDQPMQTVAVVMPDQDKLMEEAMKMAGKQAAANAAVNKAAGALGNMLGGTLGSMASQAASAVGREAVSGQMDMSKLMNVEVTEENKKPAIVQAFTHLQQFFEYDEAAGKWKGKSP